MERARLQMYVCRTVDIVDWECVVVQLIVSMYVNIELLHTREILEKKYHSCRLRFRAGKTKTRSDHLMVFEKERGKKRENLRAMTLQQSVMTPEDLGIHIRSLKTRRGAEQHTGRLVPRCKYDTIMVQRSLLLHCRTEDGRMDGHDDAKCAAMRY